MPPREIYESYEYLDLIKSSHYFARYVKMVTYYQSQNLKATKIKGTTCPFEKHHILTRKIFPEQVKNKDNVVVLPTKAHYIVHYLLYKAIRHSSCVFAFNQMRRISKKENPNCRLYAAARIYISEAISKVQTGRIMSESSKKALIEINSGTNVYRRKSDGIMQRCLVGDEPDGWEPFQTGRVRTKESKAAMVDKMVGRRWQYNLETKTAIFEIELNDGYTLGNPPWFEYSDACAGTIWVHDTATGESLRLSQADADKRGLKQGRKPFNNNGFDKINKQGHIKVVDLVTKQFCLINKQEMIGNSRYTVHGTAIDALFIYKYNGICYASMQVFVRANPQFLVKSGGVGYIDTVVPRLHHSQNEVRQQFSKVHHGKTYGELGVSVMPFQEFDFYKEEMYAVPD